MSRGLDYHQGMTTTQAPSREAIVALWFDAGTGGDIREYDTLDGCTWGDEFRCADGALRIRFVEELIDGRWAVRCWWDDVSEDEGWDATVELAAECWGVGPHVNAE